ncbi:MAG: hypothetical protein H6698_08610 [Myxococcales bacterium]|nr:hypothetical protein [Myxococcales bacterium]MCB9534352.1 hypothetical protein [Myxococcales bacterium]
MAISGRARRAALVAALVPFVLGAGDDDEARDYPRTDPDIPGGERRGADDGDDGFTGYPADPGVPGDAYRDASSEYRAYSPNWTGGFLGGGLLGGVSTLRSHLTDGAATAPAFGAFLNWSSVQQILDLQLQYTRATLHPTVGGSASSVTRQDVAGALLLHPFFLFVINSPPLAYIIANAYALFGLGAEFTAFDDPIDRTYQSYGWRVGGGIDIPVDNPNDGGGFWVGVQFQRAYVMGAPSVAPIGRERLWENTLFLRLSYRHNGNLLRGFQGPRSN